MESLSKNLKTCFRAPSSNNKPGDRRGLAALAVGLMTVVSAGTASAQFIFQEAVGTVRDDRANAIEQTKDDGFVTAGVRQSSIGQGRDIYVCRYAADGSLIWDRFIGLVGEDVGYSIRQTFDGGFIVAAETNSITATTGVSLLRLDGAGNLLWSRIYQGTPFVGGRIGVIVRELNDGGFALVGRVRIAGAAGQYGLLVRTDPAGNPLFIRRYENLAFQASTFGGFSDIREISGGFIISGFDSPSSTATKQALLLRTNAGGFPIWAINYGQAGFNEEADSLEATSDGGYAFTASDDSIAAPGGSHFVKTDGAGNQTSAWVYSNFFSAHAALREDAHGDLIIGGRRVNTAAAGTTSAVMMRTKLNGVPLFTMAYGGFGTAFSDAGEAAIPTSDCGYALAGFTQSFGFGLSDKYIVKTTDRLVSGCNETQIAQPADFKLLPQQAIVMRALTLDLATFWQPAATSGSQLRVLCKEIWCKSDFNGDGFVTGEDFDAYTAAFEAGLIIADFNCDGFVTGEDFDAFVVAFEAGC